MSLVENLGALPVAITTAVAGLLSYVYFTGQCQE